MSKGIEVRPSKNFADLVRLFRPKQWVKNVFVFAPLVFSRKFLDEDAVLSAVTAAALFCLASSAAYIINDIKDIQRDRRHPIKSKTRPLAAGSISVTAALAVLAALAGVLILGSFFEPSVALVLVGYLSLNVAYTFSLKHQPVIDIFTISIGFVLRVYAGAVAVAVQVSGWMLVTTLCLALYLAAIKRRQELNNCRLDSRQVLEKYSVTLMDRYAEMSATGALVFYSMFVMSVRPELIATIPLVLFGMFRYWYVVEKSDSGESPTDAIFTDWQLQGVVVLWVAACVSVLWSSNS